MTEESALVLTETGVEYLPDGSVAVNVGPIVRALQFLTEGRGEDRGTDEQGNPHPDLMSLAFDVVESIVVGGRKADYFRQVKREMDAQGGFSSSLSLAKQAKRVLRSAPSTALDHAADALQVLLGELRGLSLDDEAEHQLTQSLEAFHSFGPERWVSATAQLLVAAKVLGIGPSAKAPRKRSRASAGAAKKKTSAPAKKKPSRSRAPQVAAKAKVKVTAKPQVTAKKTTKRRRTRR